MTTTQQVVVRPTPGEVIPQQPQQRAPDYCVTFMQSITSNHNHKSSPPTPVRLGIYRGVDIHQRRPHMTIFIRTLDDLPRVVMFYPKDGRVENVGMGIEVTGGFTPYDFPTFDTQAGIPEEVPFLMRNGSFQAAIAPRGLESIISIIEDRPRLNITSDEWVREVGRGLREGGWVFKDPKYGFPWEVPRGLGKPKQKPQPQTKPPHQLLRLRTQPQYSRFSTSDVLDSPSRGVYRIGIMQGYCRAGGLVLALFVERETTGMPDIHTTRLIDRPRKLTHDYVYDIADDLGRYIPPEFATIPRIYILQRLRLYAEDRKEIKRICKEVGSRDRRSAEYVPMVLEKLERNYLIRTEPPLCSRRFVRCSDMARSFPHRLWEW